MRIIKSLDEELKELDARITMLIAERGKDLERISKVRGVAQVSAFILLRSVTRNVSPTRRR
jgi:hypothetical protein